MKKTKHNKRTDVNLEMDGKVATLAHTYHRMISWHKKNKEEFKSK
jgi:hypothetical protein